MKHHILFYLFLCISKIAFADNTFIHPGCGLTRSELDRMKEKVLIKESPWIDGWNAMLAESEANSNFNPAPKTTVGGSDGTRQRASRDATAAYYNILEWYVTGDISHAECAINILNAWSTSITSIVTGELFMLPIQQFMQAAELARLYPGWKLTDFERFKNISRNYFYPACSDFRTYSGTWPGWGGPANACCLYIGIFLDDSTMVTQSIDYYKNGTGGGALANGILANGQVTEMGRDQPHAEIGLSSYVGICKAALNQGTDLFSYDDNRLLKGFEYFCKFNLNHPVDWDVIEYGSHKFFYPAPSNSSPSSMPNNRIYGGESFSLAYHHYTDIKGFNAPYLRAMIHLSGTGILNGTLYNYTDTSTVYKKPVTPSIPQNLIVKSALNSINVRWTVPQGDLSKGFVLQRSTSQEDGFSTIASWNNNVTNTYEDSTLTNGKKYYYRVAAINQSGQSGWSETDSAMSVSGTSQLPQGWAMQDLGDVQTVGSSVYSSINHNTFQIKGSGVDLWRPAQVIGNYVYTVLKGDFDIKTRILNTKQNGNEIKVKTGIMVRPVLNTSSQSIQLYLGGTGTRETGLAWRVKDNDNDLQYISGSDHTWTPVLYRLKRIGNTFEGFVSDTGEKWNSVGTATFNLPTTCYAGLFVCGGSTHPNGFTVEFDNTTITSQTTIPATPTNFKATAKNSTQILLSWTAVVGAATYEIYRSEGASNKFVNIRSGVKHNSFKDENLNPNTTYYYQIKSANIAGLCDSAAVTTIATQQLQLPSVPTGITMTEKNNRLIMTWNKSFDQTNEYIIKRRMSSQNDYSMIIKTDTNIYIDNSVYNDSTYYYTISAKNSLGEGTPSSEIKATPTLGEYIYFPMDEGSGITLANVFDTSHTATMAGGTWNVGKFNKGVKLLASDKGQITLSSGIMATIKDFTISCWVNLSVNNKGSRIFDFGTGTANYMFLSTNNGNGVIRYAIKNGSAELSVDANRTINLNSWTHVAVTMQDTICTIYVNGIVVGKKALKLSPLDLGTTTLNYLGRSQWSADPYFNGTIDEFHIYKQALTIDQIRRLYNTKNQVIKMDTTNTKTLGDIDFSPAKSSSNLPIIYTSSSYNVAEVYKGLIHLLKKGITTITAKQVGTLDYAAAIPVTQILTVIDEGTPVENLSSDLHISVGPNPCIDYFEIFLPSSTKANAHITLYSINGYEISNIKIIGDKIYRFDTSAMSKGIYLLKYINGTEVKTFKIIKK